MGFWSTLFGKRRHAATMDLEEFATAFSEKIQARHPGIDPRLEIGRDPALSRIVWTHSNGMTMSRFLGNAYQAYLRQPDRFGQIADAQLASMTDVIAAADRTPEQRRAFILPIIRTHAWAGTSRRQLQAIGHDPGESEPFIIHPLAGDLIVTYIEDRPDSMHFLAPSDLDELAIEESGLHALALDNLSRWLPQLRIVGGGGRFGARLDHDYDASMVLLLEHWRGRIDVIGDPVVAIPARDELLLCGGSDGEAVRSLAALANSIVEQSPYHLSRQLFVWRDGALHPLDRTGPFDPIGRTRAEGAAVS
ncbi:MAG: hypothetical protein LBL59_07110 [Xanthomonadaceae bacterium]|jgi:uncharacterized protein YtpQ (UPF0354 family)|nr:hypothetical protein [Xanthomonadaceae bacterium]